MILYALLTTALYYLGCRARVTHFLWSRYPRWLDDLTICPACSGYWYGLGVGLLGAWLELPFLGLEPRHLATPVLVGFASIAWTPILAAAHVYAIEMLDPPDRERNADS